MRTLGISLICVLALSACGGGSNKSRVSRIATPPTLFATGPIYSACLKADRKAASRSLCGCVQAVANVSLSASDQSLAVTFFSDPHQAQVIRQSDRRSHEAFWTRYKAFFNSAEKSCG